MDVTDEIRRLADELRAVAAMGLRWVDDPYNRDRYEHITRVAAELFALTDERDAAEVQQTVFSALTHLAPLPGVDAATFDESHRILLIRRTDDGLWAMPGGACDMGESPVEAVVRETAEEAGWDVRVRSLAAVHDSRHIPHAASLQMYMFLFECEPVRQIAAGPSTPHEVLDVGWFGEGELPGLSRSHKTRVPCAFRYHHGECGMVVD